MNEFELIRTFFARQPIARADVLVGIGDDAAVFQAPPGMQTVITSDMLVAGVHFFVDADPLSVGHKALAVNLSDLAAMGAEPAWFTLALSLPDADAAWLTQFSEGVFGLARRYDAQLIGGDTVRGPLTIAITACGLVPQGKALLRAGARPGDQIYVTGELGDAGLALLHAQGQLSLAEADGLAVADRLIRPMPRIDAGIRLRDLATSMIDISDGLLADLGHVLTASEVGARIVRDTVPLSTVYRAHLAHVGWDIALANGDDYELCFTVPASRCGELAKLAVDCKLTHIGEITATPGLHVFDTAGKRHHTENAGHDHFGRAHTSA